MPFDISAVDGQKATFDFKLIFGPLPLNRPCCFYHEYRLSDGSPWLYLAKFGSGDLLRFHQLADFVVYPDGSEILCYANVGTPLHTLKHLFLDQVMPRILSRQGKTVLHASSVVGPTGAIIFIGQAGWGKSTLTAGFCQRGFAALADDCVLLVENGLRYFVHPSYPTLRLWPDSASGLFAHSLHVSDVAHYTGKKQLEPGMMGISFESAPVPLARVYLLTSPDKSAFTNAITITSISPRDAFMELIGCTYRLELTDRRKLNQEFEQIGRVANRIALRRLAFPRVFSHLRAVQDAILADV